MTQPSPRLPSVDRVLRDPELAPLEQHHGRAALTEAVRAVLAACRANGTRPDAAVITAAVTTRLAERAAPALRAMYNLTGTVLHTNMGRALLCEAAVEQAVMAMRSPCNLEFDLDGRGRGDRDTLVESLICELTGAEAATVVNNNAAAVLLTLAALAARREVVVSRGELVEIGGAFRIPDVMRAAQVRLVEVGTTNRTHARDYAGAICAKTAALMKVHASNYAMTGFTAAVDEGEVARIAHHHGLPLLVDLGAGSLVDLAAWGLPKEPVVREVLAHGADVVMFSGDKLLGGPQAGLIAGRRDLIAKIRKHPLKRALRLSKITLAALEATLRAYRSPDLLARDLPTLRLLTRPRADIAAMAARLQPAMAQALGNGWQVLVTDCLSQIGSGAMPVETLPSVALALVPGKARAGGALKALAARLAALPVPMIGRIADNRLLLDLRCLEDEAAFAAQLVCLEPAA
ncbi:MAG: L-seryl-tRNA(Sec) selenium transferase [Sphingomonadales bacterium]|nr:L-seryl-tRNA(Sec) selenium transferase [Sphingomonadales bacterium]